MTPERFRECLDLIGWTGRGLAERLAVHETRTRRWASGQYDVPPNVARWLERLAGAHERAPLPEGWNASVDR